MDLVGDVTDCDAIIIDDIVDTAGTLCKAAEQLKLNGAKRVL
jgi:ribose-phosphate pyrophosphokinase